MFFPDDAVRVAALSEYVGRWVAAEAYARMLSGDAQFRWEQGRKELFYPYGKTFVKTLGEQD